MARTVPTALANHLNNNRLTTISVAWQLVRRDGTAFRFTSATRDVTLDFGDGNQTFSAREGFQRTNISDDSELNVGNLDVLAFFDDASIKESELRRGLFDFADVRIAFFNAETPSDGIIKMLRGQLGEVTVSPQGWFNAELRDMMQLYTKELGEYYSRDCRDDLGGPRCRVPVLQARTAASVLQRSTAVALGDFYRVDLAANGLDPINPNDFNDLIFEVTTAGTTAGTAPTFDETVGNTTADGTAVLTARNAWVYAATVSAVDPSEPRRSFTVTQLTPNAGHTITGKTPATLGFPDDWFNFGLVEFATGSNAGIAKEVRTFTADDGVTIEQDIELFEALPFDIEMGDVLQITPGCDKRLETCGSKFLNAINFVGEPYVPGSDVLGQYPDARSR
jgi:hypothetical protein